MMSTYEIQWFPTIGDPTFIGWFTVLCYLMCSLLCWRVYRHSETLFTTPLHRQQLLWLSLTGITFFLGINKQLDLQTLFTQIGKYYAHEQGWYGSRRLVQKIFIVSISISALSSFVALAFAYRNVVKPHIVAICGLCFLAAFILVRASSFHSVDVLVRIVGVRFNWMFELTGIGLIALNARHLSRNLEVNTTSALSS